MEHMSHKNTDEGEERVLSKAIKAGRRTYFLDVRATRADDYYITITESRRHTAQDGTVSFDRHKLFLYKEDFTKFEEGLHATIEYVRHCKPDFFDEHERVSRQTAIDEEFDKL